MNKPSLLAVLEIALMKKRAADLYDEIDARIALLNKEFGAGRFDYNLKKLPDNDKGSLEDVVWGEIVEFGKSLLEEKPYFKFEIIDNLKKLEEDGVVWKSASFKPLSFSSGALKGCPKSLK